MITEEVLDAANDVESSWSPNTHFDVPQPAGQQVVRWYRREHPSQEDILYALAHTKGKLDEVMKGRVILLLALQAAIELMVQEDFGTLTLVPKLRAAIKRAGFGV